MSLSTDKGFSRLPANIVPINYDLEIRPDLEKLTFEGKVTIDLQIKNRCHEIVLHSIDLKIDKISIKTSNGKNIHLSDFRLNEGDETLTISLPNEQIAVGGANLFISFSGVINDQLKGFYCSKYITPDGVERNAAITQFCPTDARRCFPCWDEPEFKATFDVTLIVASGRTALSNMPIEVDENVNDVNTGILRRVQFSRTPIMSTYLLALVVGEYDFVEAKSSDGVLVRVYTPLGKEIQGKFALDVATRALPFYKNYFKIAYPLPKMDLIAIGDFPCGAMENWGLITYRETRLLVDPDNTSVAQRQAIALTVSHEIAHQWFGNLVTMKWWTDIWLNEGYASFVEYLCVNYIFPEFEIWTQFGTDVFTCALGLDCLQSSHPIEIPINHPSEINEIFDIISYRKGASVIRMLYSYIGDECFRKGMSNYLNRFQYKNASTADLWESLGEASQKPIAEIMSTWTKQMGYPVIDAELKQNQLSVTQAKFSLGAGTKCENFFWLIPLSITKSNNDMETHLMDTKSIHLEVDPQSEWLKINSNSVGFFRTKYSSAMMKSLVPVIKDHTLSPADRLNLLDDLFALVQGGQASTVQILEFMKAYQNENNYTVWSSIASCLAKLKSVFASKDFSDNLNDLAIQLFKPISEQLGWIVKPDESHLQTLLRSLVLNCLVSSNCPQTIEEARKRFNQHIQGNALLPADLRSVCYKAAMKLDDEKIFSKMIELYEATDLHEEKDRIAQSLGSTESPDILGKVIDFALSEKVRHQDSVFVLVAVATNPIGRDIVWNHFISNYSMYAERFTSLFLITRLVKYITENFVTKERALEVELFFKEHQFPGTERTVSQSVETIRLNEVWLQRDSEALKEFFH